MLLNIEPGAEWLFPFAKQKLAALKQQCASVGIPALRKHFTVDTGETVDIATRFGKDEIRITSATQPGVYAMFVDLGVGVSSRLETFGTDVGNRGLTVYLYAFDNEILWYTQSISGASGIGLLSVTYVGPLSGFADALIAQFIAAPFPVASTPQADELFFLGFQGTASLFDDYAGTYKNFADPALNTAPRAAGSHSVTLDSETTLSAYAATHALKKDVYDQDGVVLGVGLSPSTLARLVGALDSADAPDGDTVAVETLELVAGDLLTLYRLSVDYTAGGLTGSTSYASSAPTSIDVVRLEEKHEYIYVDSETAGGPGYMKWVSSTSMDAAPLETVAVQDNAAEVIDAYLEATFYSHEETRATATVQVTGLLGQISSITVNGTEVLRAAVPAASSKSATAAAIVREINAGPSSYRAARVTDTVTITAPARTGADPNGYPVVVVGSLDTDVPTGMQGGSPATSGAMRPYVAVFREKQVPSMTAQRRAFLGTQIPVYVSPASFPLAQLSSTQLMIGAIRQLDL